jgi:type IV secretory pathway TrbL component
MFHSMLLLAQSTQSTGGAVDTISSILINSIGAVSVTILFLLFMWKRGEAADKLAIDLTAKHAEMMGRVESIKSDFLSYNQALNNSFQEAIKEKHDDIKQLLSDNMSLTREVINTLAQHKIAIEALTMRVTQQRSN